MMRALYLLRYSIQRKRRNNRHKMDGERTIVYVFVCSELVFARYKPDRRSLGHEIPEAGRPVGASSAAHHQRRVLR